MDRGMWFGTKDYATWVPAPAVNGYTASSMNWSNKVTFLNGGANVRRSFGSHREYGMTWNPKPQHELSPIMDFAQGLHGDGLIYWSDPFAEYTNVLPKEWAAPVLGAEGRDGVNITGNAQRPTVVPTSANSNGFPAFSAVITNTTGDKGRKATILIPPGKDLLIGAFGSENGGTIRYKVQQKNQAAVTLNWKTVDDLSMTNVRRFSGGDAGSYVEVWINGSVAAATAVVAGAMAKIVPAGSGEPWDRFVSGQGSSGCRFDGMPVTTPYSAALDLVGMTANLTEVGAWL